MTDREKAIWAAGYFDGRGGIYQYDTQVKVIVTDKDREVLDRFHAIVGGAGWVNSRVKGTTTTNRLEFSAMDEVYRALTMLRPYITSSQKAAAIDSAMMWLEAKCPGLAADHAGTSAEELPAA